MSILATKASLNDVFKPRCKFDEKNILTESFWNLSI